MFILSLSWLANVIFYLLQKECNAFCSCYDTRLVHWTFWCTSTHCVPCSSLSLLLSPKTPNVKHGFTDTFLVCSEWPVAIVLSFNLTCLNYIYFSKSRLKSLQQNKDKMCSLVFGTLSAGVNAYLCLSISYISRRGFINLLLSKRGKDKKRHLQWAVYPTSLRHFKLGWITSWRRLLLTLVREDTYIT